MQDWFDWFVYRNICSLSAKEVHSWKVTLNFFVFKWVIRSILFSKKAKGLNFSSGPSFKLLRIYRFPVAVEEVSKDTTCIFIYLDP